MSPNGADTCTNIKALAVRACKYHPENLGDDAKIGNQLYFEINGRNSGDFYVFTVKFDRLTASETTHPGELILILDDSKRSKQ